MARHITFIQACYILRNCDYDYDFNLNLVPIGLLNVYRHLHCRMSLDLTNIHKYICDSCHISDANIPHLSTSLVLVNQ